MLMKKLPEAMEKMKKKDQKEQYLIFTQNFKKIFILCLFYFYFFFFISTKHAGKLHNSQDTRKSTQKGINSSRLNVALVLPEESFMQEPKGSKRFIVRDSYIELCPRIQNKVQNKYRNTKLTHTQQGKMYIWHPIKVSGMQRSKII